MARNVIHIEKWPRPNIPTEAELRQLLVNEGLDPTLWSSDAGDVFAEHTHTYQKIIFVVKGSITFGFPIDGEPTTLRVGDRLDLPAGVRHNAVVGPEGVTCLEAQQER